MFTLIDWPSALGVVTVAIAILAVYIESRRSRFSTMVDLLLRLEDRVHSPEMKILRAEAAENTLRGRKDNYELEMILEELSTVAFLYKRKAIDTKLTYEMFAYWIDRYWLAGEKYTKNIRKNDPMSYTTLEIVALSFIEKEKKDGYVFSEEYLTDFLKEEMRHKLRKGVKKSTPRLS